MLLDEVASYLVTQGVAVAGSTADWTVAKGYELAQPDRLITIIETGGLPNDPYPDNTVDRPTFQVRIRGPNLATGGAYSTARQKAAAIRAALDGVGNATVGGWPYVQLRVMHEPLSLGFDNTNRPTLVLNVWALRSRTS